MRKLCLVLSLIISLPCMANIPNHTLREKIGQMLIVGFQGKSVHDRSPILKSIQEYNIGGVILFDYNAQTGRFDKNIENPAQTKKLSQDLQNYTHLANKKYHRSDLPLLISVDYEGGNVARLQAKYGFPQTKSALRIVEEGTKAAKQQAKVMANTLKEAGFNLDFAPVLDMLVNVDNPIIKRKERSFSTDPKIVTEYANIFSSELLKNNIQCVYKHFPGHGSSKADSHLGFVDVTNTWKENEIQPYKELLQSPYACGFIMSAHIVNRQLDPSGMPATLSKTILTELLRHKLHFKGVIISDDMQMKAISEHYGLENAVVKAINAGADMLIFGNNLTVPVQDPKMIVNLIEKNVKEGKIDSKRIDEAFNRIISVKKTLIGQTFR